jgi:hypothetical protein
MCPYGKPVHRRYRAGRVISTNAVVTGWFRSSAWALPQARQQQEEIGLVVPYISGLLSSSDGPHEDGGMVLCAAPSPCSAASVLVHLTVRCHACVDQKVGMKNRVRRCCSHIRKSLWFALLSMWSTSWPSCGGYRAPLITVRSRCKYCCMLL